MTITLWQNCPKSSLMTVPKLHFITLELSPCDNYRSVTIFWPCPEVVIISDNHCIHPSQVFVVRSANEELDKSLSPKDIHINEDSHEGDNLKTVISIWQQCAQWASHKCWFWFMCYRGTYIVMLYTVGRPVIRKVLKIRIWGVPPRPAWAVGSYRSGSPAWGTPQILVDKTLRMKSRLRLYRFLQKKKLVVGCVNSPLRLDAARTQDNAT